MRLALFLNQIQAGVGTKDDGDTPLTATQYAIGPGLNLKPVFAKNDQNLVLTIYVGEKTYFEDEEVILRKIRGMLDRLKIDCIICGPSFNYPEFSQMAVNCAKNIQENTKVKVLCAMSEENAALIAENHDRVDIVKMPKKGGAGLNNAYSAICRVVVAKEQNKERTVYQDLIY